jgi:hypothetical protein
MVVVCDRGALERGHTHDGEVCHIIGGGPIPVSLAVELAKDAFIKAVIHDGVRIETIKHYGRHIDAVLRTVLGLGSPPRFEGAVCCEEGCNRRYGLQIDHVDPVANWGPTTISNLDHRCTQHHAEKTERDRRAGLLGKREQARAGPRTREGP